MAALTAERISADAKGMPCGLIDSPARCGFQCGSTLLNATPDGSVLACTFRRYHVGQRATQTSSSAGDHFLIGLRPTVELHERDRALAGDLRPAGGG